MSFRAPDPKGTDAMCDRRKQLEEWKKRRTSQGIGRSSLGGGASRKPVDSRRGSLPAQSSRPAYDTSTGPGSRARHSMSGTTTTPVNSSSGRNSKYTRVPLAPENVSTRRRPASNLGRASSASKSSDKPRGSSGKKVSVTRARAAQTPSPPRRRPRQQMKTFSARTPARPGRPTPR